jgi:hypothetical protein
MNVRNLVCTIAAVALAYTALQSVQAQDYTTKSVRLLVPFAPGGGNDTHEALITQHAAVRIQDQCFQPPIVKRLLNLVDSRLQSFAVYSQHFFCKNVHEI